jgi:hypothetical protein
MHKAYVLSFSFFILTLLSSIIVENAYASIPKPSIPEFKINLIDSSYDIPTKSYVDPYTGQNVTQAERHVESRTIKLSIKNQPFTPFIVETSTGNWTVGLHYNIRWKGHFEDVWHEIYTTTNGYAGGEIEGDLLVVSYAGKYSSSEGLELYYQGLISTFPPGAKVDFQVEAMIGYIHRDPLAIGWIFTGETSGWTGTQTITISDNSFDSPSPSSSQTPSAIPSQPIAGPSVLFDWNLAEIVGVVLLFVVLLFVGVVFLRRRRMNAPVK